MTTLLDVGISIAPHSVSIADLAAELGIGERDLGLFQRYFGLRDIRTAPGKDDSTLIAEAVRSLPNLIGNEHRVKYVLAARTVIAYAKAGDSPVHQAITDLGLHNATVFTVNQQACASGLLAVQLAGQLLRRHGDDESLALVVTGEKAKWPSARLIPGTAVMGDSTAAALVSASGDHDQLMGLHTITDGRYHDMSLEGEVGAEFAQSYTATVVAVIESACEKSGISVSDLSIILPHNVNRISWARVCKKLNYPIEQVLLQNVPHLGHCFSADTFINYVTASKQNLLEPGDYYLMAAVGMGATYSAAVFKK